MAYIGRPSIVGNFVKLDAISVVNGQAAYTMQNSSANFTDYSSVNQFMVSLNGTIQSPGSSFTVSGSTITFASNLVTNDVIDFIIVFGNSLSSGVPTDATVSTAKIVDDAVTPPKTNFFNTDPGNAADLGNLHVKTGDRGVASLSVSHDELVVESDGNAGISIIGGGSNQVGIAFGDSADSDNGRINYVHSDTSLRLINNATENVRIHSNGVMAANAGIALGVGTANTSSNVLDDYEEGTWTPTFTHGGSSVSYTLTRANYTKVGRLVYVTMTGRYTGSSLTGGDLIGGGLPFTSSSDNVLGVTGGYIHDPGSGNSNYDAGIAGSHNGNTDFYLIVTPGGRYQQRWLQNYYLQTGFWYFV